MDINTIESSDSQNGYVQRINQDDKYIRMIQQFVWNRRQSLAGYEDPYQMFPDVTDDEPSQPYTQYLPLVEVADTELPANIANLSYWNLTISTDGPDPDSEADIIRHPELDIFKDPNRFKTITVNGIKYIMFGVLPTDTASTQDSDYIRVEFREIVPQTNPQNPEQLAAWKSYEGKHILESTVIINQVSTDIDNNPVDIVVAQVHGTNEIQKLDDTWQLRLKAEEKQLVVHIDNPEDPDEKLNIVMIDNYQPGMEFSFVLTVANNIYQTLVIYTDATGNPKVSFYEFSVSNQDGLFDKLGLYNQAKSIKTKAEVLHRSIIIRHSK